MTTERRYFTLSNAKTKPRRRSGGRRAGWIWLLGSLLALCAVLLAAWLLFPKAVNPDRVIRYFRYMGLRDKAGYGNISFESAQGNAFAGYGDGLLVGGESGLTLYALDGDQKGFVQGAMPTPVLSWGETMALCYSPGSSYVAALSPSGEVLLDETLEGSVVDADVSRDGCMACLTSESGYKSVATVRNSRLEPIYRFSSRTRYLNACAVSEAGEYLVAASLEEADSVYRSGLIVFRTDHPMTDLEEGDALRLELGNQLVYDLDFLDRSHFYVLAQNELRFYTVEGELLRTLEFQNLQLLDYCASDKGWMLTAFRDGSGDYKLLSFNPEGESLGSLDLTERIRSVSAAGNYAAVLTDQYVATFDRRLKAYDSSDELRSASRVLARADGTALLVSGGSTQLFIP